MMNRIEVKLERTQRQRTRPAEPANAAGGGGAKTGHCFRRSWSVTRMTAALARCAAITQANTDGGGDSIVFSDLFNARRPLP